MKGIKSIRFMSGAKRKLALLISLVLVIQLLAIGTVGVTPASANVALDYDPVSIPRLEFNMNADWKFYKLDNPKPTSLFNALERTRKDGKNFFEIDYDDSSWEDVSVPHPFGASDMYRGNASSGGDRGTYQGIALYRKEFKLEQSFEGKKIFLEFEGMRQAAYVYLNGKLLGYYEAGIVAFGFDLSAGDLNFGDDKNVIAIANDTRAGVNTFRNEPPNPNNGVRETRANETPGSSADASSGGGFQWTSFDFNPSQGGLTRNVTLYVKSEVYQTLPLYRNLRTKGVYIYPSNINVTGRTARINVESEVRNESATGKNIFMDVAIIDRDGQLAYSYSGPAVSVARANDIAQNAAVNMTVVPAGSDYDAAAGAVDLSGRDATVIKASFDVSGINLWSDVDPYLYDVYTILKDGDDIIDVVKTTTGFRKAEYRGGTDGGVFINDEYVWLTGYAQRTTNEWAAVGIVPDWLADWEMSLVRESNANHIRWMHVAPYPAQIRATDKYGIVSVVPAGDKENANVDARQWNQRLEAMRDVIIYYRNSPSTLFWEIGNSAPAVEHRHRLGQMMAIKDALDPNGMRAMGCRSINNEPDAKVVDYVGTMLGRQVTTGGSTYTGSGRAIINAVPILETEYTRDESPRRVWDRWSPPDFDYVNYFSGASGATPPEGRDAWDMTAEEFVVANAGAYNEFYSRRMQANARDPIYSGTAALCWSDSNQHGRQTHTETGRMSGRVDPVRIKKQSFYAYQALQSQAPKVYLVGHWNYPTDPGDYEYRIRDSSTFLYPGTTALRSPTKTIYVIASNVSSVELFVNGVSAGIRNSPTNNFVYRWDNINILERGDIRAVGYNSLGVALDEMKIETVGAPVGLRLTPMTAPDGMRADGSDIAFIDVEVVDAQGRVHPLNYDKIEFSISGPATIMGGYNSGSRINSEWAKGYNKSYFFAENGVNRLFIKAGRQAGEITVKMKLEGFPEQEVKITSKPFVVTNGLSGEMPSSTRPDEFPKIPELPTLPFMQPVSNVFNVAFGVNTVTVEDDDGSMPVITIKVNGDEVDLGEANGSELEAYVYGAGLFAPAFRVLDALRPDGVLYSYNEESQELRIKKGADTYIMAYNTSEWWKKTGNITEDLGIVNNMPDFVNETLYIEIDMLLQFMGYNFNRSDDVFDILY